MKQPPSLEISLVSESQKGELWPELQSYLAELSKFSGEELAGEFPYRHFVKYWQEPTRWPFWIAQEDQRAGFALVRKDEDGSFHMAEFYIKPEYRRSGIGTGAARALVARFQGRWHVSEMIENVPATRFWRSVLNGLVPYEETTTSENVVQSFAMPATRKV